MTLHVHTQLHMGPRVCNAAYQQLSTVSSRPHTHRIEQRVLETSQQVPTHVQTRTCKREHTEAFMVAYALQVHRRTALCSLLQKKMRLCVSVHGEVSLSYSSSLTPLALSCTKKERQNGEKQGRPYLGDHVPHTCGEPCFRD